MNLLELYLGILYFKTPECRSYYLQVSARIMNKIIYFKSNIKKMRIVLIVLGLINGLYMFADGIFVILNGKYIGPDKPGPWSSLFTKLNIDVFKLGPMFVIFGLLWFLFIYGLQSAQNWIYWYGIVLSIATLWYLPIGTLISVVVFSLLVMYKDKIGL